MSIQPLSWIRRGAVFALALALTVPAQSASPATPHRLIESGSTLFYPLMQLWAAGFPRDPDVSEVVTQSTGSGKGIEDVIAGAAHIGASDAFLSDPQLPKDLRLLQIPVVISSQLVVYNVPEIGETHLNLSAQVLAEMFGGSIKTWDDPRIRAINPGVTLPHRDVIPIHRLDGSGDTAIFTQYLSALSLEWRNGPGTGKKVNWPAADGRATGSTGTVGVLATCEASNGGITYAGISYLNRSHNARLGYAALENHDRQYILPNVESTKAAAYSSASRTPADGRLSLIDVPGRNVYPIVNYEYAIVRERQADADTAAALRRLLTWMISPRGGSTPEYLNQVYFVALPDNVVDISKALIAKIQ